MTARRPHPKSKLGCKECKRRRIKCDEGRPICHNCRKRGLECSFSVFDPISASGLSPSQGGQVASHIHVFPQKPGNISGAKSEQNLLNPDVQTALLGQFAEKDRSHFQDVLQHFASDSIPTLHAGASVQTVWRNELPRLARSHEFVLHGMIAIGSLHLAQLSMTGQDRDVYENIAANQMNTGMSQYRSEVENVTKENAEALLAFTSMVTVYVLQTASAECEATLKLIRKDGAFDENIYASILKLSHSVSRVLRSIRGVLVIIVPYWNHIQSGPLGPALQRDWWPLPIPITQEEVHEDERLRKLETMWSRPERVYDYSFDTLRLSLKSLRETFALVSRLISLTEKKEIEQTTSFDWGSVITWPIHLSLEFLKLLENHCAEAWVLMAHYAMLVDRVKGISWFNGFASNLISTAALVIGQENWEWITWPAEMVKVDLETLRNPTSLTPLSIRESLKKHEVLQSTSPQLSHPPRIDSGE